MRDMVREGANLLVAGAIAFVTLGAFFVLSGWGLLKYTEDRWGVAGVESLIGFGRNLGIGVLILVVVVIVWKLVDSSYRGGGQVATNAMTQTVDGIGVAVDFFTAAQKAQAEAVKVQRVAAEADAARAKVDAQMDLKEWEYQLEQKRLEARQQYALETQYQKQNMRQQAALEDRQRREQQAAEEDRRIRQMPWMEAGAGRYDDEDEEAVERAPRFRRMH